MRRRIAPVAECQHSDRPTGLLQLGNVMEELIAHCLARYPSSTIVVDGIMGDMALDGDGLNEKHSENWETVASKNRCPR